MAQINDPQLMNPWRRQLMSAPASFRRVVFHAEAASRNSGRRTVVHEYPKRADTLGPYAEDMGKHAIRFSFSGYLVYRPSNPLYEYTSQRARLIVALEREDAGTLIHPVFAPGGMLVMCERYSVSESRERGGFTQFDMNFVQAGRPGNDIVVPDTAGNVKTRAGTAEDQGLTLFLDALKIWSGVVPPNAPNLLLPQTYWLPPSE